MARRSGRGNISEARSGAGGGMVSPLVFGML